MTAVVFVLALCLAVSFADHNGGTYNDIESAYRHAFAGYDKNVPPKTEPGVGVNVTLDFVSIHLHEVEDGEISMVAWLKQSWEDPRLHWDSDHYDGTRMLAVPAETIWMPDIAVYNSITTPKNILDAKAIVNCDGTVLYVPALRFCTTCAIKETDKEVTCAFKLGSWVYDNTNVDVFPDPNHIEVSTIYNNPSWSMEFLGAEKELKEYNCCLGKKYASVIFSVRLVRNEGN